MDDLAEVSPEQLREAEAAMMASVRDGLLGHCGANPSEVQRALVDRVTWLRLYLSRMDGLAFRRGQVWSGKGAQQYLAYSRELTHALGKLGIGSAPEPPVSLSDILATMAP